MPAGLDSCASVAECLSLIDRVTPPRDDGEGSNADILAAKLQRFGVAAKRELLKRAVGEHPGRRNVAGAILSEWHSWFPSDVPQLREALRKQHGGWVAVPLAEIGSPDAIQALVDDLPNGTESQTDYALSKLGARAIPFLVPLLQTDKFEPAAKVIRDIGSSAIPFAAGWVAVAINSQEPLNVRIGALRGIAAIGDMARPSCSGLHALISNSSAEIRRQVQMTLRAIHDPFVVVEVARSCRPAADPFDSYAIPAFSCLRQIALYGEGGGAAGDDLLPFLESRNGAERSYAITTLGAIGYSAALPQIEASLNDMDWRVVYAAIRAVGWLDDRLAIPRLQDIGAHYWLPEIRKKAAQVAAELASSTGSNQQHPRLVPYGNEAGEPFAIDHEILSSAPSCSANIWNWNGTIFGSPPEHQGKVRLLASGGKFIGTNHGEWGGELSWVPDNGNVVAIHKNNVVGIESAADGPIVLFGLAHLTLADGYALHVRYDSQGKWERVEVARLPAEGDALAAIAPNLFAAWSSGRVVVFSNSGILGLASCHSR